VVIESQLREVIERRRPWLAANATPPGQAPVALLPGSFNPLHQGHRQMQQYGAKQFEGHVAYELSATNVDKPPLAATELTRRLSQFDGLPVFVTAAPTFVEKAELFPGAVFLVGADTIHRVGDPAYYAGNQTMMRQAIEQIAQQGNRFLVFARVLHGQLATVDSLGLPGSLAAICDQAPPESFRFDISSTELRR